MKAVFPFEKRNSPIFGRVYRPVAIVSFWSRKISNWVNIPLIVDSGADYTILPHYQAQNLGVNLEKDCAIYITEGIGGKETVYLARKYRVRLGKKELSIPVGFLERDNIPPLLGRQDFLEKIKVIFEKHLTTFEA